MATARSAAAPAATLPRALPRTPARIAPAAATVVGVAVALKTLYGSWYLNYDARYALLWARDVTQGFRPEYGAEFAPTPHPLATALSALALPFGDRADVIVTWLVLLCFGGLVWLVYRLGAELFTPWAGVVAALVVLTRPAFQRDALQAYQDVLFETLVIGAVLLEARTPRRGWPVLALLGLAGLLRPEAWVLSALYVGYLWPRAPGARTRLALVAAAALAPALWALTDWLVTGDPLHSLHGTAALAQAVDRRRHLSQVPYWTPHYFGYTLREPLVVGVPVGLAFAWLHCRRRAALPLAVAIAMTVVFMAGPLFGLPLIGRYLRTPSILLALFYGLAVAGWLTLRPGRSRRRWRFAGLVALALSIAYLPRHGEMLASLDRHIAANDARYADLRAVARRPDVRAAFAACRPLTASDHRPIPYLRYWLDGPPRSVRTTEAGASRPGGVMVIAAASMLRAPRGYERLYATASWLAYAAPRCVTRPRA